MTHLQGLWTGMLESDPLPSPTMTALRSHDISIVPLKSDDPLSHQATKP
jgi:hypothetical protein